MYVVYFDEIKPNPHEGRHCYIVGGITVKMSDIALIESKITELSLKFFDTAALTKETEFHASDIYFRKGNFKKTSVQERLKIFESLIEILSDRERIKLSYACINTDKLYAGTDSAEQAFMHFIERAENTIERDNFGILIGDLDDEKARDMVKEFSRYRSDGTNSRYGKVIKRIVDSVHFCRSHHSRMIQLADAYLFLESGVYNPRKGWMADQLRELRKKGNLFPTSYKEWPK